MSRVHIDFVCAQQSFESSLPILQAVKYLKEDNEMEALVALIKLSSLVTNLPALEVGASEPELIASSLQAASTIEERQKIFYMLGQLHVEGAPIYAELLGFEASLVVPRLMEDLAGGSKGGA